jgi:serine/threonine protein kinase
MGDLRHQNIVTLVGACWGKDLMALVMEFCEKGMASDVLKEEGSTFSWDDPVRGEQVRGPLLPP